MPSIKENIFLKQLSPKEAEKITPPTSSKSKDNIFLSQIKNMPQAKKEQEESFGKNAARTALQIPLGRLSLHPRNLIATGLQAAGVGHALESDELEHLRMIYEREGIPFDEEKYRQQVDQASSYFPTVQNAARIIEEKTGLPLTPKTKLQKGLNIAGAASRLGLGQGLVSQGARGAIGGTAYTGLVKAGVPEGLAEPISLGIAGATPNVGTKTSAKFTPESTKNQLIESGGSAPGRSRFLENQKAKEELQLLHPSIEESSPATAPPRELPSLNEKGKSLQGRVQASDEEIIFKPPSTKLKAPTLESQISEIFTPERFYNTTHAGKAIKRQVMQQDQQIYRNVNKAYKTSRELNSNISEIHPNLVSELQSTYNEIEKIPSKSTPQKELQSSIKEIVKSLAEVGENGQVIGYKPISNQVLIDQIQSLRQKIDYDFAHGDARNIFKPTIRNIQDAVEITAEESGNIKALEALRNARSEYKAWNEKFDNDYIRPIRDRSNKSYTRMFKDELDLDEFNVLKNILQDTDKGKSLLNATKAEIVEKHLKNFMANPKTANANDLNKVMRELRAVITPEESKQVSSIFEKGKRAPFKATEKKFTKLEKTVGKYADLTEDAVQQKLSSPSGILELKKDLSLSDRGKEIFSNVEAQEIRSMLQNGKINDTSTGQKIYDVLNQEKNYDKLVAFRGKEQADEFLDIAKSLADKQLTKENLTKKGWTAAKIALGLKLIKYIHLVH